MEICVCVFVPVCVPPQVALIVYWISVTALLYSAGDLTANCRNGTTTPYTFSQLQSFYNGTSAPSGNTGTFECFQNASRCVAVRSYLV